MNISNIMGALFPIFFVLALGYLAGRRNTFDADQAAGFSKLALSLCFARVTVRKHDGYSAGPAVGARAPRSCILSHVGLFLIAWIALRQVASLRGTPAIIYSLMLATSATPVFGLAVLEPILGASSAGAVGLVALAINLTVPLAVVLLEMDAAARNRAAGTTTSTANPDDKGRT
jgi:malonate transporter and related proteins